MTLWATESQRLVYNLTQRKVKAFSKMPTPIDVHGVRRFVGMATYLSRFAPNMGTDMIPLHVHELTKKGSTWNWGDEHNTAFQKIKDKIVSAPILKFYDSTGDLTLENNASEHGLGLVLLQAGRPVAFASRRLTDSEMRYAQIEKEMLAVGFGLIKFHQYTFGRRLCVFTDHKPLVPLMNKPLARAPRRIQNMMLKIQDYDFELIYRPGRELVLSDTLSRAPLSTGNEVESYVKVNNLSYHPISTERLSELRKATDEDSTFSMLRDTIKRGWPE